MFKERKMGFFPVRIDLSSFYSDCRAKSVIFVDSSRMQTISLVEDHIKSLFNISEDICSFWDCFYLPGKEDSRVLEKIDCLKIVVHDGISDRKCDISNGIENEGSPSSTKKRKKSKDDSSVKCNEDSQIAQSVTEKKKRKKEKNLGNSSSSYDNDRSVANGFQQFAAVNSLERLSNECDFKRKKIEGLISDSVDSDNSEPMKKVKKSKSTSDSEREHINALPDETKSQTAVRKKSLLKQAQMSESLHHEDVNVTTDSVNNLTVHSSTTELQGSMSNLNDQDVNSVQKKKRQRTRKRKNKVFEEITDLNPVQTVAQPEHLTLRRASSKGDGKHIFFGDLVEYEIEGSIDWEESDSIINETETGNASVQSDKNDSDVPVLSAPKPSGSLSKLLSLKNTEGPPVFQRKKLVQGSITSDSPEPELKNTEGPPAFQRKKLVQGSITSDSPEPEPAKVGTVSSEQTASSAQPASQADVDAAVVDSSDSSKVANDGNKCSILTSIPDLNSTISFKILKISSSYCPELSKTISGVVESTNPETNQISLRLISGAEEFQQPHGKFDLDPEEIGTEVVPDRVQVQWNELLQPTLRKYSPIR